MNTIAKQFRWDQLDRVFWTLVQVVASVVTVEAFNLPKEWIPVFSVVLAIVKTEAAKHVGLKDTGALLPAAKDPASPPQNPPA